MNKHSKEEFMGLVNSQVARLSDTCHGEITSVNITALSDVFGDTVTQTLNSDLSVEVKLDFLGFVEEILGDMLAQINELKTQVIKSEGS